MKSSFSRFACFGVMAATIATPVSGAVLVQELFDGANLDAPIGGQGANLTSSIGFAAGSTWVQNAGGNAINTANNFNLESAPPLPGLSPQQSSLGGVWRGGTNNWATNIFATRQLAGPVNFNASSTLYFSVRLNNTGDAAVGIGIADGTGSTANFVGVGGHWDNATALDSSVANNSLYTTWGTLGQDLLGNNDGPYAIQAHSAPGSMNFRGLVVGQLITTPGADTLNLKLYPAGSTIDNDLGTISWTLTDTFSNMTTGDQLLLWLNGAGNAELDAIRIGTTWQDVTGVALIPEAGTAALMSMGLLGVLLRRRR